MFVHPMGEFEAKPLAKAWGSPWSELIAEVPAVPAEPWQCDETNRKLFGIELAKAPLQPFQAALNVFGDDTNKALWASVNWKDDALVIASRDLYQQTVEVTANVLDKDAFSVKLLKLADEKSASGFYINDAQDRLKALELYAKVRGFIGNVNIDASNNTVNNTMEIVLIKSPEQKIEKVIQHQPDIDVEEHDLGVELQLVGTGT